MRILVTGASGAIGSRLTRRLAGRDHHVRALSRREARDRRRNVEYTVGDLLDRSSLERALQGMDCVVHLAAITHAHDNALYEQVNVAGTRLLATVAARAGTRRFVFVSSRAAHERGGAYGLSKLRAEQEVKSAGLRWVILRPSEVYGAGTNEAIARIIRAVTRGPFIPVIGRGDALVAPVYVDDVIDACEQSVVVRSTCEGKSYTLAGPEEMTLAELVDRIEKKLGIHRPRLHVPVGVLRCIAVISSMARSDLVVKDQVPRLFCPKSSDISPARTDLQYNPRTLEQGLEALQFRPFPVASDSTDFRPLR